MLEVSLREAGFDPITEKSPERKPLENIGTKNFRSFGLVRFYSRRPKRSLGIVEGPNTRNRRFRREIGEDGGDSRKTDENCHRSDGAV